MLARLVEDRGVVDISSRYHTILFNTSYYNSYSMIYAVDLLYQYYLDKKRVLSVDEVDHLKEPEDVLSLYEFMTSEHTDMAINRFKSKLVKLIKEIHYHHVSGDGSEVRYVEGRYKNPLKSVRGILQAILEIY